MFDQQDTRKSVLREYMDSSPFASTSTFFKTQHGADVSDVITSLLATCTETDANAFEYLQCVQRNQLAVRATPERWLPWNYPVGK